MEQSYPKYCAAAVQAASVYLNREATVEKACRIIDEAAQHGAKLIVFPESFIPGYPEWVYIGASANEYAEKWYTTLYHQAVEIPSTPVCRIAECARKNHVYVCISVTERDNGSLYLAQLWFNSMGDLIGKHRKVAPTSGERAVWGRGDGSMMPVMKTELGNLGGLQCWEHLCPLNLAAMNGLNEQVHAASWPTMMEEGRDHMFSNCGTPCNQYYALATGTFVIVASQIYTRECYEMLCLDPDAPTHVPVGGGGYSRIFNPCGTVISNSLPHNVEGIAYAEIDLSVIPRCKFLMDPAGHYSTPGFLSLTFDTTPQQPVRILGPAVQRTIPFDELMS